MRAIVGAIETLRRYVTVPLAGFVGHQFLGLEIGALPHEPEGLGLQLSLIGLELECPLPIGFGAGRGGAS